MMDFTPYGFKDITLAFINSNGFKEFTPIQQKAIPAILKKEDIVAISATGTGKTHAFLIPLLEMVDIEKEHIQAVITAPTRELATQLYNNALLMKKVEPRLNIKLISGGTDRQKVSDHLKTQPHIVIGTPGRIKDLFLTNETLLVNTADIMVIDEGDMTFEYGFLDDIDAIAGRMGHKLQMLVFSATIPQGMKPFLKKYMNRPKMIKVTESLAFSPKIEHVLVPCKHKSYMEKVLEILPGFQPFVCLIFANTRVLAHETAENLRYHDYRVIELHGDLSSRERRQALNAINNKEYQYIVATDIASRGLDIDSITHVISMGFPNDLSFYIHRSGRTGRSGREGICYALYNASDDHSVRLLIEKGIKFIHRNFHDGQWNDMRPYNFVRRKQPTELDMEIAKIVKRPVKVKPGYKKRREAEVAKLKHQKKREMIKDSIKTLKKEKAKQTQREKSTSQS